VKSQKFRIYSGMKLLAETDCFNISFDLQACYSLLCQLMRIYVLGIRPMGMTDWGLMECDRQSNTLRPTFVRPYEKIIFRSMWQRSAETVEYFPKLSTRIRKFEELAAQFNSEPPEEFHELIKILEIPIKNVVLTVVEQMRRKCELFRYMPLDNVRISSVRNWEVGLIS
jgi:hypothetical protein